VLNYDDVIVGAGSTGAALAARLSEDPGRKVALLEAGPDYANFELTPEDLRNSRRMSLSTHDWGFTAEAVPGRMIPYPRGRVTGGSSAVNATIALRGVPADYDEWAALGNGGWGWKDVLPYFRRLEDDPVGSEELHGRGGPVPICRWRRDELIPTQRAFFDVCRRLGFPEVTDHNDPEATGVGPSRRIDESVYDSRRRSRICCLPANGRTSPSSRIVSWTACSPSMIERSASRSRTGGRAGWSAGVGSPWRREPSAYLRSCSVRASVRRCPSASSDDQFNDMQLVMFSNVDVAGIGGAEAVARVGAPLAIGLPVALERPLSRGRVTLASAAPAVPPLIELNFADDPEDLRRLMDGVRLAWRVAHEPGVAAHVERVAVLTEEAVNSDEALSAYVRATVTTQFHPSGTARMGPAGDGTAVVDAHCRMRGVDNLRVVDASIMPTIPRANINLTSIMIGERVADWIRHEP
jgi:choline dehydrogenase